MDQLSWGTTKILLTYFLFWDPTEVWTKCFLSLCLLSLCRLKKIEKQTETGDNPVSLTASRSPDWGTQNEAEWCFPDWMVSFLTPLNWFFLNRCDPLNNCKVSDCVWKRTTAPSDKLSHHVFPGPTASITLLLLHAYFFRKCLAHHPWTGSVMTLMVSYKEFRQESSSYS